MNKLLIILILLFSIFAANASMAPGSVNAHAIGLRENGGFNRGSFEISYQNAMGSANRLELDLGWAGYSSFSSVAVAGIYQWVWNISGGFNWYAGPGAQIGFHSNNNSNGSGPILGVGGQVGIEYDFNALGAPIQVSLDVRPLLDLLVFFQIGYDGALSVRYSF